ncbi:DUF5605 domain-containing protein [Pseudolysinimonas yzui]|uniref:DUF5060 domain-containing protein n=1 Tax=Pseudolysinimonas yzui TaxID=2708254 RepID=A0A8J3E101_9MICO|nr:DUF5605 domain-containing protein [Pseudolysinimonas yzui]GHF05328.1 hypothetical protein GCM10011600_02270 [Pseudolysinimonas yzui]
MGDRAEVRIDGPRHGNPFVDVDLSATFTRGATVIRAGGFYDGDGRYVVRFLPTEAGEWDIEISSTEGSLDGLRGRVSVARARDGRHGVVGVADRFHFAHADGTRFTPVGTTLYAWTHQPEALQQETLATLAAAPFTKVRMGIFPKSYLYNEEDPELYPFESADGGGWDVSRFSPGFFAVLERRIRDLDALGIQADLILFHPYDRWGFADLGPEADDRYLRYVVRRLAAFPNVWWSMANEFDLMLEKTEEDWERLAAIVVAEDPAGHLLSIHNCLRFYDYARDWITHVSLQRIDIYKTAENTDAWRDEWGKPVVVDEVAYEGDLDQGWGNISGQELTRRFWEGTVRGGYLTHGETYLSDDDVIFWSKGGTLRGSSPPRIAFLRSIIAASPTGAIDPLPGEWDAPWGGVAGEYAIVYYGFNRPSFRTLVLPEGEFEVDVIDTWNMTVTPVPGRHRGRVLLELPGREFMAARLRRAGT